MTSKTNEQYKLKSLKNYTNEIGAHALDNMFTAI